MELTAKAQRICLRLGETDRFAARNPLCSAAAVRQSSAVIASVRISGLPVRSMARLLWRPPRMGSKAGADEWCWLGGQHTIGITHARDNGAVSQSRIAAPPRSARAHLRCCIQCRRMALLAVHPRRVAEADTAGREESAVREGKVKHSSSAAGALECSDALANPGRRGWDPRNC